MQSDRVLTASKVIKNGHRTIIDSNSAVLVCGILFGCRREGHDVSRFFFIWPGSEERRELSVVCPQTGSVR